ncbi:phytoene desaturase family protein [Cytophagaceae bacterium ABcell3]|nr:phytoene desaturase family protein [Cytophagaceae bacterium ABcell3]
MKTALIIGTGLGGLSTALRLTTHGYKVTMVEKYHKPGGRLNQLESKGFKFDMGPSFFSMSYEFEELFKSCNIKNPLSFQELDPLYAVNFEGNPKAYLIHKNLDKLAEEFAEIEPNFKKNAQRYLQAAKEIFHDTEHRVIKRNFSNKLDYLKSLTGVPLKHGPKLFRTMWKELESHFSSEEVKIIFSLVAFFLGSTPFDTPAVYSLLNYTELQHDGYWKVKGGMYKITEELVKVLEERKVEIHYNTEIKGIDIKNNAISNFIDQNGKRWKADVYVTNSDAAAFRGKILGRKKYEEKKLDKMHWTLAPFTIYLGVKGKIPNLHHHNYFLGNNFKAYSDTIFKTSVAPEKPYYYVNVSSKSEPSCAPPDCENLFILCPVPDKRFKSNWTDREALANNIIADLSKRISYDLKENTITQTILDPCDWEEKFNLYKGSGLGLAHDMSQVGGFRPANKDEELKNLYYTGASTVPGTGLPIVVISSRLATERILKDHGTI